MAALLIQFFKDLTTIIADCGHHSCGCQPSALPFHCSSQYQKWCWGPCHLWWLILEPHPLTPPLLQPTLLTTAASATADSVNCCQGSIHCSSCCCQCWECNHHPSEGRCWFYHGSGDSSLFNLYWSLLYPSYGRIKASLLSGRLTDGWNTNLIVPINIRGHILENSVLYPIVKTSLRLLTTFKTYPESNYFLHLYPYYSYSSHNPI